MKQFFIILLALQLSFQVKSQMVIKQFFVAPFKTACGAYGENLCIQIKEKENEEWRAFRENIEGFKFKKGYLMVIEVESKIETNNLTAEKKISYKLRKVIEFRKVKAKKKEAKPKKIKEAETTSKVGNSSSQKVVKQNENIQEGPELQGKKWILKKIFNGSKVQILANSNAYVEFDKVNGKINGNATCNRFFGAATYNKNKISVLNMGSTRMLCRTEMEMENLILTNIQSIDNYKFVGSNLHLLKGNTILMVLE